MPRRRSVTRTREIIANATRYAIEPLEPRQLFDTIGLNEESGVFEYKDGLNNIVRIAYRNVLAELVFARVNPLTNETTLSSATPAFAQEDGKDLFHIYVAQAGPDSFISVATVPAITTPQRPMQPFNGSVSLSVFGREGLVSVSTDGGSGTAYLGARTKDTPAQIPNEINRPILSDQFFGMGILGPRKSNRLTAGLYVETGQDLGRFFWGGAISGQVTLGGSVDTFYAGALLTGDTRGDQSSDPSVPNNFVVNGDIRDLIVMGSIGTHADANGGLPIYDSGFDMQVNGTIGRVQTYGSVMGDIRALNDPAFPRLRMNQHEIETKVLPRNRGSLTHFQGNDNIDVFDNSDGQPRLGDDQGEFNNDTFETAQFLGTFNSRTLGSGAVAVNGRLQNVPQIQDETDFYGVPLMAGQAIQVQLLAPDFFVDTDFQELEEQAVAFLNVYDPDGNLVGGDTNNFDVDLTANKQIQFIADRPGVYRFEVTVFGRGVILLANIDYQLRVQNVGTMSIGAVNAAGDVFGEAASQHQFVARNGDLGVVYAGGGLGNAGFSGIFADGGNLRAVDAANIGIEENSDRFAPNFEVYGGDLGVMRARTSFLNVFNMDLHDNRFGVGGSAQLIEAPDGYLLVRVNADKRIGVIRADNMSTFRASMINVNADQRGGDGLIDLIDVDGNFGAGGVGGPQITTGPGGNVRYIHVGGELVQDIRFAQGVPDEQVFDPGQSVNFIDDSGTQMLLAPTPNRTVDPNTGLPQDAGTLTLVQYGIRDKGGKVLVRLDSTRGVDITSNGQSGRGTAEVSEINAALDPLLGTPIVEDLGTRLNDARDDVLMLDEDANGALAGEALEVQFHGNAVTDVFEITGGNFTQITNHTRGEIVSIIAASIGDLSAQTLGLAKSHTGTLVGGNTVVAAAPEVAEGVTDEGPFSDLRIGVRVTGDIVSARALGGLGNFVVDGSIQELIANADGVNQKGVHEGINAPIMTRSGGAAAGGGGEIRYVQIGEGLLPSGTGSVSLSGIFAHSRIGLIENQGEGSDIRGDIISKGQNLPTFRRQLTDFTFEIVPLPAIGVISLNDGAIIGSDIMVVLAFSSGWEIGGVGVVAPSFEDLGSEPAVDIEAIGLNGKGGIMTSEFFAADIGAIEVKGGFGILNTSFQSLSAGSIGSLTADGFGIRNVSLVGGSDLGALVARSQGQRIATTEFTSSVRMSERFDFDPFSGYVLTELNDLHYLLGTSAESPVNMRGDRSRSGVIDEVDVRGSGQVDVIDAHQIKSSAVAFAGGIGSIVVRDYIDTLELIGGRLDFLQTTQDVYRADWHIAGPVGTVRIGGTWRGTSYLGAEGVNGQIGKFQTGRALYGTVVSANDLGELAVATDIGSVGSFDEEDGQRITAGVDVGRNLNLLRVGGSILDGATLYVDDRLGTAIIDGDVQEEARIDVGTLGTIRNAGSIFGDFIIRSER